MDITPPARRSANEPMLEGANAIGFRMYADIRHLASIFNVTQQVPLFKSVRGMVLNKKVRKNQGILESP